MLQVTWIRIKHARLLREAFGQPRDSDQWRELLDAATAERLKAKALLATVIHENDRYPEAQDFVPHDNPTSYQYGYLWPAASLHFWDREEQMIRQDDFSAFFMNIYDIERILL
jgi:hypothetical protein